MNKNTKMLLGIGILGVVGYIVWKQQSKPKAGFANLLDNSFCPCKTVVDTVKGKDGKVWDVCAGGQLCPHSTGVE